MQSISSIRIQGFRSFRERTVYKVPRTNGLFLVRGTNGAGKSSFFDAICWCFYGKTARGVTGPAVTSWGEKHTEVRVVFTSNGEKHILRRTRHPNSLNLDGEEVQQPVVDAVLGVDYERFLHVVLLGQFNPLFCDLRPAARLELLTSVLSLEQVAKAGALAQSDLREHVDRLNEAMRKEAAVKEARKFAAASLERWQKRWVDGVGDTTWTDADEQNLVAAAKGVERMRAKVESASALLKRWASAVESKRGAMNDAENQARRMALGLESAQNAMAKARAAADAGECPTCGQPVKAAAVNVEDLASAVLEAKRNVSKAAVGVAHAKDAFSAASRSMLHVSKVADSIESRLQQCQANLQRLESKKHAHQQRLKESADAQEEIDTLQAELRRLDVELTEAQANVYDRTEELGRLEVWPRRFKELRLFMVDEALNELGLAVNASLGPLGLHGWAIEFRVERETKRGAVSRGFEILVRAPGSPAGVPWAAWSGGETQRLRVACAAGLSELVRRRMPAAPSWEAWDEPTTYLSGQGVDALVDYFVDRSRDRQLWLIDHRSLDAGVFDAVLHVEKDDRGTRLA